MYVVCENGLWNVDAGYSVFSRLQKSRGDDK